MGIQQQKTNDKPTNETLGKAKDTVSSGPVGQGIGALAGLAGPMTTQRAMSNPESLSPREMPGLQRSFGNKYLQMMVAGAAQQRAPDKMAGDVQRQITDEQQQATAEKSAARQVAQRQPAEGGGMELNNAMTAQINREMGRGGAQLPNDTQVKMKQNMGMANPESIQVHTGDKADRLSKSLGARAFTTGNDMFFREGEYDPGSTEGQKLIYHEGVHTMQQGGVKSRAAQTKMTVNAPGDKYEQEADEFAEEAVTGGGAGAPRFASPNEEPNDETSGTEAMGLGSAVEQSMAGMAMTAPAVQMAEDTDEEAKKQKEEADKKKEEKKKETSKEEEKQKKQAEEQGKEKGEKQKKKTEGKPPKVPKPKKDEQPEQTEAKLPLPAAEVDVEATKFDAGDEHEEPEQEEPLLPTWGELAAGTVQMSPETVQEELSFREGLNLTAEGESEGGLGEIEVGSDAEEGEGAEDVDKGALIGEALGQGALAGLQEGATEFISDQIIEAATSKIPYADGFINMAKIAQDPNQWFQDNVMAIGDGAKGMVKGFSAIGDEDTAWGYMAATLEAIIGVIDFINSILGLINTIFQIILAISKAMVILGNAMIALAPVGAPFFPFAWTPAVFTPIVTFFTTVISFLDPVNNIVSAITNILLTVKYCMQPFVILFRILDIAESKADPEKLKEKQAKLQSATKGFVKSTTQKVANKAKDKAVAKMQTKWDAYQMKKAEQEAETAGVPKEAQVGELSESQQAAKDKLDTARKKYKESKEAEEEQSWAGLLPHKAIAKQVEDIKKEGTKIKEERERRKKISGGEKVKNKEDEATEARELRELSEQDYEAKKSRSDNDLGVQLTKDRADESYRNLTDVESRLDAAKKRGADEEEIKGLEAELNTAKEEHRKRQDAYISNVKQQEENEKATEEARQSLERRRQREEEARNAAEETRQKEGDDARNAYEKHERWKKEGLGLEGLKQAGRDVGGWNLLSGGDMGGQRHGGGITGASSKLFDLIEEQTGVRPDLGGLLAKAGFSLTGLAGWGSVEFADAVSEAQKFLAAYRTSRSPQDAAKLSKWLGKIDANEQGELAEAADALEARADEVPKRNAQLKNNLKKEAKGKRELIASAQAIIEEAATYDIYPQSEVATWAQGYGAKVFTLNLKTAGLPPELILSPDDADCKRADPEDPIFVVKGVGEKGIGASLALLATTSKIMGAELGSYEEYDKEIKSAPAQLALYKGKKYSIEPRSVTDNSTDVTYEPRDKTVAQQGNDITTVTVTYRAQNEIPVPEVPGVSALQSKAVSEGRGEANRAASGGESILQRAEAPASPERAAGSLADITIQRAPAEDEGQDEDKEKSAVETGGGGLLGVMIAGMAAGEEEEAAEAAPETEEEEMEEEEPEADMGMEAEEEMDEGGGADRAMVTELYYQVKLMEALPDPPEGVFERVEGAALAYREVDDADYALKLQKQDVRDFKRHGAGQLAQLKDTRALTAANQKGVAAHQADADTKLAAQSKMKQASTKQEAGAKKTADQSGQGGNMLSSIFSKVMQGLGLGIGGGGASDAGAAPEGGKQQAETSEAAAQATKDAGSIADKRTAETHKVKADAKKVQDELTGFDQDMGAKEESTAQGLAELDNADMENEEKRATVQEEKMRLQEEHTTALEEADEWAEEHRAVREEILSELEGSLAGGGAVE